MPITIDKDQDEWLRRQVANGAYRSVDEAVQAAVCRLMQDDDESDDLEWAKPLIAEGLAQLDRGESMSHDEVFERLAQRLASRPPE